MKKIERIKGDKLIIVMFKNSSNILFSAFLKKGLEKRADIANLIVNHFKQIGYEVSIKFSEIRYTPFIVKKDGEVYEFEYCSVPYYIVK